MTDPAAPPEELIVHILLMGRAFCGQEGVPADWPPNHKWVGAIHDPDLKNANCQGCIDKWKEWKHRG